MTDALFYYFRLQCKLVTNHSVENINRETARERARGEARRTGKEKESEKERPI